MHVPFSLPIPLGLCQLKPDSGSRTEPTPSEPLRLPSATRGATRLLPNDPDLAAVVAAWPELPEAIKAGILAMVKTAVEATP
jgi:hypothetical protein